MGKSSSGRSRTGSEASTSRSERRRSTIDENESTSTITPSRMKSRTDSTASGTSNGRRRSSRPDTDDYVPESSSRRASSYSAASNAPSNATSTYMTAVDGNYDDNQRAERRETSRRERGSIINREGGRSESTRALHDDNNRSEEQRSSYSRRESEKDSNSGSSSKRRDSKRHSTSSNIPERRDSQREGSRALSEQDHNAALPQNQFPNEMPDQYTAPYRPPGLASDYYGDHGESVQFQPGVRPNIPNIIQSAEQAHLHEPTIEAHPPPEPSSLGHVGAAADYFGTGGDGAAGGLTTPSRPSQQMTSGQPQSSPRASPGPPDSRPSTGRPPSFGVNAGSMGAAAAAGAGMGLAASYYAGHDFTSQTNNQSSSNQTFHQSSQYSQYNQAPHSQYVQGPQSQPPQDLQGGYGSTSRPPKQSSTGPGLGTVAAAGLATAGAAAYLSHHHDSHSHSQSQQNQYASGSVSNLAGGYSQTSLSLQQQQRLKQKHRHQGPISRFVDWFRDPSGVAQFEAYTEAIGVCKYCFDPTSSPLDAPRKHHYCNGRPSNVNPTGQFTSRRVTKAYRHSNGSTSSFSSSDEERRRRKSSNGKKMVAAGLAGAGAVKIGEALYNNRNDFDDTYSVRSGRPISDMQQRMQTNASRIEAEEAETRRRSEKRQSTRTRLESTEDTRLDRKSSTTSRKSRRDSEGVEVRRSSRRDDSGSPSRLSRGQAMSIGAGAAVTAAAVGAEVARRRRSRSRSRSNSPTLRRKKSYYSKRVSPRHSYVDLSTKNTGPLGFGGFFSSPSANERRGKKKKGLFVFRNDSTSSSDADLAFGEGTIKRKSSKKDKTRRDGKDGHGERDAILGLAATGAALAAESEYRKSSSKSRRDTNEKPGRSSGYKINMKDNETTTSDVNDEGIWEDASDDDSVDTALAYGGRLSAKTSRESLAEQGTSKWNWRWKDKKAKKATGTERRQSESFAEPQSSHFGTAATAAVGAGIGAAAADAVSRKTSAAQHQQHYVFSEPSPGGMPPMQYVDPFATSDSGFFDARATSTIDGGPSPHTFESRSPAPLKQPQPQSASFSSISTAKPTVLDRIEAGAKLTGSPEEISSSERTRLERRDRADSQERTRPLRRDSSPPPINPSAMSRNSVMFNLTDEQIEAERLANEKEERRRRRKERERDGKRQSREFADPPTATPTSKAASAPDLTRKGEAQKPKKSRTTPVDEHEDREAAIQRELEALYAQQDRHMKQQKELDEYRRKHGESGGVAAALVGAGVGAAATAMLKDKKSSESESDRKSQRKSSLKKGSQERTASPPKSPPKSRSESPPKETQQERIARMAAQRVKSTASPVHEDYSTFFVPAEIAGNVKDHNEAAEKRVHDLANVITIDPDGSPIQPTFDPFVYLEYGQSRRHDASKYGWSVPRLELEEPTPPGSRSSSRARKDEVDLGSPVSPARGGAVAAVLPRDSIESVTDEDLPRSVVTSSTGSKVTFGGHSTHEYEVQTPEWERNNPHDDSDKNREVKAPDDTAQETADREPVRKVYPVDKRGDTPKVTQVPPVEEMTSEQREHVSKGKDFKDMPLPKLQTTKPSTAHNDRVAPIYEHREPSPSPSPSPIGEPDVKELLGSRYMAPFSETVSDLGDIGDYSHREVPKTGQGFVESQELPTTPREQATTNGEVSHHAPTESNFGVVDGMPHESRSSRSERRRLERAMPSSENVTPVIRTPQPESNTTTRDGPSEDSAPKEMQQIKSETHAPDLGVFDFLVDDNNNPIAPSDIPAYNDLVKSAVSQMSRGSTERRQKSEENNTTATPSKPHRSYTLDDSQFEREVPRSTEYASDPEDWERKSGKKSNKSKESSSASKSEVGFGTKAALAGVAGGAVAATVAAAAAAHGEPDFYAAEKEKSRESRRKKRESEIFDEYDGKSTVSLPATRDEDKKSRRRSKRRDSDDLEDEDRKSIASLPATKDEDDKSRRRKRDSDVFKNDDDDARSVKSTSSEKRKSRDKDSEKEREIQKKSSGFFGLFGKSSEVSSSSKKSSKSESRADRDRASDKHDEDRERRRKRRSKGEGYYDDAASIVSEPVKSSRRSKSRDAEEDEKAAQESRDVSVDDGFVSADDGQQSKPESFLAKRPEMPTPMATEPVMDTVMPTVTDGVSGLKTESVAEVPASVRPESEEPELSTKGEGDTVPASVPLPIQNTEEERSLSEGDLEQDLPLLATTPQSDRQRRLSAIRAAGYASSPVAIQSPTAVPLQFGRRYPVTPNNVGQTAVRSSPIAPVPSSPLGTPRTRQGRPKSSDFSSSREYRPLYLVEHHSAAKAVTPDVDENLPSLPSSRTTSAHPSTEDLRGQAMAQLEGREDDYFAQSFPHDTSQFHDTQDRRPLSPDFLDSRSATPVPGEKQRARDQDQVAPPQISQPQQSLSAEEIQERRAKQREREMNLLFHSPSELLQDPVTSGLVQPADVEVAEENRAGSPLPSVISTSQDEEFLSAESGRATPVFVENEPHRPTRRSSSRSRSGSSKRNNAISAGLGVLGGLAAGATVGMALNSSKSGKSAEAEASAGDIAPEDAHFLPLSSENVTTKEVQADIETATPVKKSKKSKKNKRESAPEAVAPVSAAQLEPVTEATVRQKDESPFPHDIAAISTAGPSIDAADQDRKEPDVFEYLDRSEEQTSRNISEGPTESSNVTTAGNDFLSLVEPPTTSTSTTEEEVKDAEQPTIVTSKKAKKDKKKKRKTLDIFEPLSLTEAEPTPETTATPAESQEKVGAKMSPLDDAVFEDAAVETRLRSVTLENTSTPAPEQSVLELTQGDEGIQALPSKKTKEKGKGKAKEFEAEDNLPDVADPTVREASIDQSQVASALPLTEEPDELYFHKSDLALGAGAAVAAAGSAYLVDTPSEEQTKEVTGEIYEPVAETAHVSEELPATDHTLPDISAFPELTRTTSFQPSAAQLADKNNDLGAFEQAFERALQSRGLAENVTREEALDSFLPRRDNAPFIPKGGLTPVPEGTPATDPTTPTGETGGLSRTSSKKEKRKGKKSKKDSISDLRSSNESLTIPEEGSTRGERFQDPEQMIENTSLPTTEDPFGQDFDIKHSAVVEAPEAVQNSFEKNPFGTDFEIKPEIDEAQEQPTTPADKNPFGDDFEVDADGQIAAQVTEGHQVDDVVQQSDRDSKDVPQHLDDVQEQASVPAQESENQASTSRKDKKKKRKSKISAQDEEPIGPETSVEETSRELAEPLPEEIFNEFTDAPVPPSEQLTQQVTLEDSAGAEQSSSAPKSKKEKRKKKSQSQASMSITDLDETVAPMEENSRELGDQQVENAGTELPIEDRSAEPVEADEDWSAQPSGKKSKKDKKKKKQSSSSWADNLGSAAIVAGTLAAGATAAGMLVSTDGKTEIVEEPPEIDSARKGSEVQRDLNISHTPEEVTEDSATVADKKGKKDKKKKKNKSLTFSDWDDQESEPVRDTPQAEEKSSKQIEPRGVSEDAGVDLVVPAVPEVPVESTEVSEHLPEVHRDIGAEEAAEDKLDVQQSDPLGDTAHVPGTRSTTAAQDMTDAQSSLDRAVISETKPVDDNLDTAESKENSRSDGISNEANNFTEGSHSPSVPALSEARNVSTTAARDDLAREDREVHPTAVDAPITDVTSKKSKKDKKKNKKRQSVTWEDETSSATPFATGVQPPAEPLQELQQSVSDQDVTDSLASEGTRAVNDVGASEIIHTGIEEAPGQEEFNDKTGEASIKQVDEAKEVEISDPPTPAEESTQDLYNEPITPIEEPSRPIPEAQPIDDWTAPPKKSKKGKKAKTNRPPAPWDNNLSVGQATGIALAGTAALLGAAVAKKSKNKSPPSPSSFKPYRAEAVEAQEAADDKPVQPLELTPTEPLENEETQQPEQVVHGEASFENVEKGLDEMEIPQIDTPTEQTSTLIENEAEGAARDFNEQMAPEGETAVLGPKEEIARSQPETEHGSHDLIAHADTAKPTPIEGEEFPRDPIEPAEEVQPALTDLAPESELDAVKDMVEEDDFEPTSSRKPKKDKKKKRRSSTFETSEPATPAEVNEEVPNANVPTIMSASTEKALNDTDIAAETVAESSTSEPAKAPVDEYFDENLAETRQGEEEHSQETQTAASNDTAGLLDEAMVLPKQGENISRGMAESAPDFVAPIEALKETQLEPEPEPERQPEGDIETEALQSAYEPWDLGLSKKDKKKKRRAMEAEGITFDEFDQPVYPIENNEPATEVEPENEPKPEFENRTSLEDEVEAEALRQADEPWYAGLSKKERKKKRKAMEAEGIVFNEFDEPIYPAKDEGSTLEVERENADGAEALPETEPTSEGLAQDVSVVEEESEFPLSRKKSKKDKKKQQRAPLALTEEIPQPDGESSKSLGDDVESDKLDVTRDATTTQQQRLPIEDAATATAQETQDPRDDELSEPFAPIQRTKSKKDKKKRKSGLSIPADDPVTITGDRVKETDLAGMSQLTEHPFEPERTVAVAELVDQEPELSSLEPALVSSYDVTDKRLSNVVTQPDAKKDLGEQDDSQSGPSSDLPKQEQTLRNDEPEGEDMWATPSKKLKKDKKKNRKASVPIPVEDSAISSEAQTEELSRDAAQSADSIAVKTITAEPVAVDEEQRVVNLVTIQPVEGVETSDDQVKEGIPGTHEPTPPAVNDAIPVDSLPTGEPREAKDFEVEAEAENSEFLLGKKSKKSKKKRKSTLSTSFEEPTTPVDNLANDPLSDPIEQATAVVAEPQFIDAETQAQQASDSFEGPSRHPRDQTTAVLDQENENGENERAFEISKSVQDPSSQAFGEMGEPVQETAEEPVESTWAFSSKKSKKDKKKRKSGSTTPAEASTSTDHPALEVEPLTRDLDDAQTSAIDDDMFYEVEDAPIKDSEPVEDSTLSRKSSKKDKKKKKGQALDNEQTGPKPVQDPDSTVDEPQDQEEVSSVRDPSAEQLQEEAGHSSFSPDRAEKRLESLSASEQQADLSHDNKTTETVQADQHLNTVQELLSKGELAADAPHNSAIPDEKRVVTEAMQPEQENATAEGFTTREAGIVDEAMPSEVSQGSGPYNTSQNDYFPEEPEGIKLQRTFETDERKSDQPITEEDWSSTSAKAKKGNKKGKRKSGSMENDKESVNFATAAAAAAALGVTVSASKQAAENQEFQAPLSGEQATRDMADAEAEQSVIDDYAPVAKDIQDAEDAQQEQEVIDDYAKPGSSLYDDTWAETEAAEQAHGEGLDSTIEDFLSDGSKPKDEDTSWMRGDKKGKKGKKSTRSSVSTDERYQTPASAPKVSTDAEAAERVAVADDEEATVADQLAQATSATVPEEVLVTPAAEQSDGFSWTSALKKDKKDKKGKKKRRSVAWADDDTSTPATPASERFEPDFGQEEQMTKELAGLESATPTESEPRQELENVEPIDREIDLKPTTSDMDAAPALYETSSGMKSDLATPTIEKDDFTWEATTSKKKGKKGKKSRGSTLDLENAPAEDSSPLIRSAEALAQADQAEDTRAADRSSEFRVSESKADKKRRSSFDEDSGEPSTKRTELDQNLKDTGYEPVVVGEDTDMPSVLVTDGPLDTIDVPDSIGREEVLSEQAVQVQEPGELSTAEIAAQTALADTQVPEPTPYSNAAEIAAQVAFDEAEENNQPVVQWDMDPHSGPVLPPDAPVEAEEETWATSTKKSKKDKKKKRQSQAESSPAIEAALAAAAGAAGLAMISQHESKAVQEDEDAPLPRENPELVADQLEPAAETAEDKSITAQQVEPLMEEDSTFSTKKSKKDKKKKKRQSILTEPMEESTSGKASAESLAGPYTLDYTDSMVQDPRAEETYLPRTSETIDDFSIQAPSRDPGSIGRRERQYLFEGEEPTRSVAGRDEESVARETEMVGADDMDKETVESVEGRQQTSRSSGAGGFAESRNLTQTELAELSEVHNAHPEQVPPAATEESFKSELKDDSPWEFIEPNTTSQKTTKLPETQTMAEPMIIEAEEETGYSTGGRKSKKAKKAKNKQSASFSLDQVEAATNASVGEATRSLADSSVNLSERPTQSDSEQVETEFRQEADPAIIEGSEWTSDTKKAKTGKKKKSSKLDVTEKAVEEPREGINFVEPTKDVEMDDMPLEFSREMDTEENEHKPTTVERDQAIDMDNGIPATATEPELIEEWAKPSRTSKKDKKKKRKSTVDVSKEAESPAQTPRSSQSQVRMVEEPVATELDRSVNAPSPHVHSVEALHNEPVHQAWLDAAFKSASQFPPKPTAREAQPSAVSMPSAAEIEGTSSASSKKSKKKGGKVRSTSVQQPEANEEQAVRDIVANDDVVMADRGQESDGSNVSESTRERRRRRRSPPLQRDHDPDDLPRPTGDRALTPPPEHDDLMDTALGIAAGLGLGASETERHYDRHEADKTIRDSGVQFDDPSATRAGSSVRDSGFVPSPLIDDSWSTSRGRDMQASEPETRRPTRPHSPTSSTEDVRINRRSIHTEAGEASQHTRHLGTSQHNLLETPARKQPSPVNPTSKDRSSVLFHSSPAGQTPKTPHSGKQSQTEPDLETPTANSRRSPSTHDHHKSHEELRAGSPPSSRRKSNELASSLINRAEAAEVDRSAFSPSPVHSPDRPFSPTRTPLQTIHESQSGQHNGSLALGALAAGGLAAGALAASARDDPTNRTRSLGKSKSRTGSLRDLRNSTTSPFNGPELQPTPSRAPVNESGASAEGAPRNMAESFEGLGSYPASPASPTRPPSVKRRQSMQQIRDLEARVDQLANENRSLAEAKVVAERHLQDFQIDRNKNDFATDEALRTLNEQLRQRDEEIVKLREQIETLAHTHESLKSEHETRYSALQEEHNDTHAQWQQSTRELGDLKSQHEELSGGVDDMVRSGINTALAEKNAEVQRLRRDLEAARQKIRELQSQILAQGADEIVTVRDEDYFDHACQALCQHVQQWVLRFSKFSDTRVCYGTDQVRDEKVVDRFDNAVLDGSEVDSYLSDRVKRRDVFMSVVMTMIWEHVFSRYLFGMDRDQRQKLKQLEKNLLEVGPANAVHQWRAITLTLLSKREVFRQQRESDSEAVVIEIMRTLKKFLPPPQNLEGQIHESLRKVLRMAADLSIEMRTQKAEYIMLPPLQPEYNIEGDLVRKVYFNASLMNERSGETSSNEDLESSRAVVRIVLFPLVVVKKGDDGGRGSEEIVVCPAQVLVARPDKGKRPKSRLASGGSDRMSIDQRAMKSTQSLGAMSGIEPSQGNMF